MKKPLFLILMLILIFGVSSSSAQFIKGELFIKLTDNSSSLEELEKVLNKISGETDFLVSNINRPFFINNLTLKNTYHVTYTSDIDVLNLIQKLNEEKIVDYAEQVPEYDFFFTPNDLQTQQWNLQKINAELSWDFSQGSSNVIVAIIDDAILLSHQDLSTKIWINTNEIPMNGIDDDGNGFIDDINGWDAADNDNDPNPFNPTNSSFTHGTHCAGISASATNNNVGISSIGFNTTIMPVKIAQSSTHTLTGSYIGVQYAIINNANVISMSWGGSGYSSTFQALFDFAYSKGITCIAAAGNSNSNIPMYPASYNHVISVGASDLNDTKASFSNYGSTIDVMAPGVNIYSTLAGSNSSYGNLSGTSMACPLVSGLAALMISYDFSLTPDDLEQCLKSSCDNIDALNPTYINQLGAGRLNAYTAMQCIKPISANFTSNKRQICPGQNVQYTDLSTNNPISWQWSFPGGTPSTSALQHPIVSYSSNGIYSTTLIATNNNGTDTITIPSFLTVANPTASMSGSTTLLSGFSANIPVFFSGVPPFNFTYSDGTSNYIVNNTISNPHYITVNPSVNTTYTLVNVNDANCIGAVSGSTNVTIITGGNSCAQGAAITFQKVYGGAGNERAHSIQQTTDGGYILAGETTSFGAGNTDWFVMKTNSNGVVQWTKTFGSTSLDDGNSITIKQTNDLGYIIAGHTEGFGAGTKYDSYIIKLNNLGNILWEKRIPGSWWDSFRDVIELSNGDILLTGSAFSYSAGNMDAHVVKITSTGNLVWIKNLGTTVREHSQSIIELPGGNYILSGNTNITNNSVTNRANPFLIKTSNNGNVIWSKQYDATTFFSDINETILLNDGNLLNVGETRSSDAGNHDIFLLKTDTNGVVIWSRKYGGSGNDIGVNVKEKANGELVISAFTNGYGNTNQLLLFNTDGNGNVIWSKTYGGSSNEELDWWGKPMVLTANDEIIIAGGTRTYGVGNEDIYLIKTNECGESFCNEQTIALTTTSPSILASTFSVSTTSGGSLVNTTSTVKTINFTNNTLCADTNITVVSPICNLEADFSITLSCFGDSTYFSDLSTDSIGTIINWYWYFGDGDSLIGIQNPNHLYTSAGTFNVKLIVVNDTNPFCSDTIIKQLIIADTLIITLPANDTICIGDTTNLAPINLSCGRAPFSYSWTPILGLNNPFISNPLASPPNTTTYTLTVTDSLGNISIDSITIFVDTMCCKTFAQIAGNTQFCQGDSIQLINNSLFSVNANYNWNFGAGSVPSSFNGYNPPLVFYSVPGIHNVQLIITDSCGSDTDYFNINIFPLPIVPLQQDIVICGVDTLQIGETAISDYSYLWNPGTNLSDSTISNPLAYIQSNSVYILKVTDMTSGCILYDTLNIEIRNEYLSSANATICQGDSVFLEGSFQFAAGVYTDSLQSSSGCDSIVTTTLSVSPIYQENQNLVICQGDSILLGGAFQNSAGVYTDVYSSIFGCDSIIVSTLIVNPNTSETLTPISICDNDSVLIFGTYQTQAGVYNQVINNGAINGCDSIVYQELLVNPTSQIYRNATICSGDSIFLGGAFQTVAGNYVDVFSSSLSCDSIVTTNLNVVNNLIVNINDTICQGDSILISGNYQTNAGTYSEILVSSAGCDSLVIINLTVDSLIHLLVSDDAYSSPCESVELNVSGGNSYFWSPSSGLSCTNCSNPIASPFETTTYTVIDISNNCSGNNTNTVTIFVQDENEIFVPNVFTPNKDGQNDGFNIKASCIKSIHKVIYNRWGMVVFESTQLNEVWDGRTTSGIEVPDGTYFYIFDVTFDSINGTETNKIFKGTVTLLR